MQSQNFYLLSEPGERHEDMIPVALFSDIHKLCHYLKENKIDMEHNLHVLKLNKAWKWRNKKNLDFDYTVRINEDYIQINDKSYTLNDLPQHLEGNHSDFSRLKNLNKLYDQNKFNMISHEQIVKDLNYIRKLRNDYEAQ